MSTKKLITVFGATGKQGGSVVDMFLSDAQLSREWRVRGVTRDVSKESSRKLADRGVDVVSADMNDTASLQRAMAGSDAVFAVTNYWETMSKEVEVQQGRNLADAALAAGVAHFVFSSLPDAARITAGRLSRLQHFDSKAAVERYVRTTALPATFFMPGFYMTNLPGQILRRPAADAPWTLTLPVPETTSHLPLFHPADTGKYVKAIVLRRDALLGANVRAAAAYLTPADILRVFRAAFPADAADAVYVEQDPEEYLAALSARGMPDFAAREVLENMLLLHDGGYYGGAKLEDSVALVEGVGEELLTWEKFVKVAEPFKGLK